jgi:hypothetical protein
MNQKQKQKQTKQTSNQSALLRDLKTKIHNLSLLGLLTLLRLQALIRVTTLGY